MKDLHNIYRDFSTDSDVGNLSDRICVDTLVKVNALVEEKSYSILQTSRIQRYQLSILKRVGFCSRYHE